MIDDRTNAERLADELAGFARLLALCGARRSPRTLFTIGTVGVLLIRGST